MSHLAPLSLFISSKMRELTEERHTIQTALKEVLIYGWLWETDAGARPEPHPEHLSERGDHLWTSTSASSGRAMVPIPSKSTSTHAP